LVWCEYSELRNLNENGVWQDFDSLYYHFHQEFLNLPSTPVMISEFGTLKEEGNQNQWITNAFNSIENKYEEIKSVIYFNSKVDNNWPGWITKIGLSGLDNSPKSTY
jgi:cellulose synthase (UDP-forming)